MMHVDRGRRQRFVSSQELVDGLPQPPWIRPQNLNTLLLEATTFLSMQLTVRTALQIPGRPSSSRSADRKQTAMVVTAF